MRTLAVVALLALGACDNFQAVQQANTIEAYEDYLAKNPDSSWKLQAQTRLEELYLENAKKEKSLDAYDAYLKRFPEGIYVARAMEERETFAWEKAESEHTVEAYKAFLETYPRTKKEKRDRADRMMKVAEYAANLEIGATETEQVNLAENPEGPLDGWSFKVPVKNNGTKTLKRLDLTIEYLDADGIALDRKEWPVTAEWWPVPIEEEHKTPIKPGDSRVWWWTTGDMPAGWSKQVRVYPSRVNFADEK
jgi:hypothetical protein